MDLMLYFVKFSVRLPNIPSIKILFGTSLREDENSYVRAPKRLTENVPKLDPRETRGGEK